MLILLACLLLLTLPGWSQPADLVIKGDAIYTVDAARRWVSAVAVKDGRFVYVGPEAGVRVWLGPDTEVLELGDRMMLPGFHDSHVHPAAGGLETLQCDLNSATTVEQIETAIVAYAQANPEQPWIVGGGWALTLFPEGHPTKEELDRLVPDRPVFLTSADAHTAWVNSKAMELAGITSRTEDPDGGKIVRDAQGEPTGLLREEAISLVSRLLPESSVEDYRRGLRVALKMANSFGITSMMEANANEKILQAYRDSEREGTLTARVLACQSTTTEQGPEQVAQMVERRESLKGRLFRPTAAKIFADGVIEGHTAALLEPYLDTPGDRGLAIRPARKLWALMEELDQQGFQIHVHAIGDRGIRESLDGLQKAREANGARDARHHLAHIQLIAAQDVPRFRELDVMANMQPLWAYRDVYIEKLTEPVLGPERSRRMYPFKELHDSGAVLVAGSDWTVSTMNPLPAIQVGLTRSSYEDAADEPWLPEQRLSLPTLLAAYTINGAYGMHQEQETGSIEVGKAADFVILDRDLFRIDPHTIKDVKVDRTYLEGRLVYSRNQRD